MSGLPRARSLSEANEEPGNSAPGSISAGPVPSAAPRKKAPASVGARSSTPAKTAQSERKAVMANDYRSLAVNIKAARKEKAEAAEDLSLVVEDVAEELAKLSPESLQKTLRKLGFVPSDSPVEEDATEVPAEKTKTVEGMFFDGAPVPGHDDRVYRLRSGKSDLSQDRSDYTIVRKVDWEKEQDEKQTKSGNSGLRGMLFGNPAAGN